jgi:hypothetical protein
LTWLARIAIRVPVPGVVPNSERSGVLVSRVCVLPACTSAIRTMRVFPREAVDGASVSLAENPSGMSGVSAVVGALLPSRKAGRSMVFFAWPGGSWGSGAAFGITRVSGAVETLPPVSWVNASVKVAASAGRLLVWGWLLV